MFQDCRDHVQVTSDQLVMLKELAIRCSGNMWKRRQAQTRRYWLRPALTRDLIWLGQRAAVCDWLPGHL